MQLIKTYIFFIFILSNTFAQNYLELNKFLAKEYDEYNDISYIQMHPKYDEEQPADKGVTLEFYHGQFDGSKKSDEALDFIKSVLDEDKRINEKYEVPTLIYAKDRESIEENPEIQRVQNYLKLTGKTKIEVIPSELNFDHEAKNDGRSPDSIKIGALGWTLIRGTAVTGASFAGLVLTQGLSPMLSASIAIWPGLASGAITYYNGQFGDFLTNGKWSKWLMESDKPFAKKMRNVFNINYETFGKKLADNPRYFRVKYPDLYKKNPELFEKFISNKATTYGKQQFSQLVKKLSVAEEYFKWYLTEVMFVGGVIKIPQAIAGVGTSTSLLASTAEVFTGAAYGMLAQGPGDIAIQKRKFQKIDELLKEVQSNSTKFSSIDKKEIIEQITKLQDSNISYQIGKESHKALQRIENWARSRATMLSFFSVAGVSLEMAGIPAAKPILIATGIGGGFYYAQVSGWVNLKNLKTLSKDAIASFTKFLNNPYKVTMSSIASRLCKGPFVMKTF